MATCNEQSNLPLELLRSGVSVRLRVSGRSMTPYLVDNDLVTLEPVDSAYIRLGDLVFTQLPGQPPLLHRVIERTRRQGGGWSVLTKGDALMTSDPALHGGLVAGRVVAIQRNLPNGFCREVWLKTRRQRCLQRCLALGSRHAPRSFAAISRRLAPGLERLAGWFTADPDSTSPV